MHPTHRVGLPRRELLRLGLLGAGGLTLSGLQRLRATTRTSERTAIIVVWLPGGASHILATVGMRLSEKITSSFHAETAALHIAVRWIKVFFDNILYQCALPRSEWR